MIKSELKKNEQKKRGGDKTKQNKQTNKKEIRVKVGGNGVGGSNAHQTVETEM